MRFFGLFALAAAAVAPFVAAAPAPVDAVAYGGAAAKVHVRAPATDLHARVHTPTTTDPVPEVPVPHVPRGQVRGVAAILIDLKVSVKVYTDVLYSLTADTCTSDVLTVNLKGIVTVIAAAVVELKALVGADVSVIFCAVDGIVEVTVDVVAQLLADILILIFGALAFILSIVVDITVLIDVIVAVAFGDCICGLINAVLALVAGLIAALIPLVVGLLGTILALGLNIVAQLLCIL